MSRRVWILTAFGKDRPGIVAQVTQVLYGRGCNLEDSAMTRLAGEFAIMLTFSAPASLSHAKLQTSFQTAAKRLSLAVHLKPLAASERTAPRIAAPYAIAVYGADRPGIVYRVSSLLARLGVNITDVSTRRAAGSAASAKPLYLMMLEVELSRRISPAALERRLKALAKPLGVFISLRPASADVL